MTVTWDDVTWADVDWSDPAPARTDTALGVHADLGRALTRPDRDGVLLGLVAGLTGRLAELEALASGQPDGAPGWTTAIDPDADDDLDRLGWLARVHAGVEIPDTYDADPARTLIRERPATRRGTPHALVSAVRARLTGTRRVELTEHDGGDPLVSRIRVYRSEALNEQDVIDAVAEQKPLGRRVNVEFFPGQDWDDLRDRHATWDDVLAAYGDWDAVRDTLPPEEIP